MPMASIGASPGWTSQLGWGLCPPSEIRPALLEEGLHRFVVLRTRVGQTQRIALAPCHLAEVGLLSVVSQERPDQLHRVERAIGELLAEREGASEERVRLEDLGHEPTITRLGRGDHSPCQAPFDRTACTDEPRKEGRAAELGHEAHAHEEKADARLFTGDADVEGEDLRDANADGGAVDRGDRGLGHALEESEVVLRPPVALRVRLIAAALELGVEDLADVGASTEVASGAGHDDGADIRVGVGALHGVTVFGHHARRPCVEFRRPVQRDERYTATPLDDDLLVVHVVLPWLGLRSYDAAQSFPKWISSARVQSRGPPAPVLARRS